ILAKRGFSTSASTSPAKLDGGQPGDGKAGEGARRRMGDGRDYGASGCLAARSFAERLGDREHRFWGLRPGLRSALQRLRWKTGRFSHHLVGPKREGLSPTGLLQQSSERLQDARERTLGRRGTGERLRRSRAWKAHAFSGHLYVYAGRSQTS